LSDKLYNVLMYIKKDLINHYGCIKLIIVFLFFVIGVVMSSKINAQPLMIAHAGGGIDGKKYTNSIEALNNSYAKGFRYFELDFSWTSDQQLVCLHDWDKRFKLNFGYKTKHPLSLQRFQELLVSQNKRHPCTLESLSAWVLEHPDSTIITDVKYNNIDALKLMLKHFPELSKKLIPQFYQPHEYEILKELGFKYLIWILYQFEGKKSSIKHYAKNMQLFAISMRASQAKKRWAQELINSHHTVFTYTVNKHKNINKLFKKYGVKGMYTDFLGTHPINNDN